MIWLKIINEALQWFMILSLFAAFDTHDKEIDKLIEDAWKHLLYFHKHDKMK